MSWKETGILQQLSFLIREIHSIERKLNLARQQFTEDNNFEACFAVYLSSRLGLSNNYYMNTVDSLGFYDRSHNELKQHRQWRFSTEGRNYRKHTTDFKHEFSERCSTAFSVTLPKLIAEHKFSSRQVYHLWPITHFELSAISNCKDSTTVT